MNYSNVTYDNEPYFSGLRTNILDINKHIKKNQINPYKEILNEYNINKIKSTKTERKIDSVINAYNKEYYYINVNGRNINFIKPVTFCIEQDNSGYYFNNEDLNIVASGKTLEEAEINMYKEFLIQWGLYAREDDSKLTPKAKRVKKNLLESIII